MAAREGVDHSETKTTKRNEMTPSCTAETRAFGNHAWCLMRCVRCVRACVNACMNVCMNICISGVRVRVVRMRALGGGRTRGGGVYIERASSSNMDFTPSLCWIPARAASHSRVTDARLVAIF